MLSTFLRHNNDNLLYCTENVDLPKMFLSRFHLQGLYNKWDSPF